ncbi:MAG: T9SS type A sorting domain-containing protein [Bacteroidota bacterium]
MKFCFLLVLICFHVSVNSYAQIVSSDQKINQIEGAFSDLLEDGDAFGTAVAVIGDLDEDGFDDLVVGAPGSERGNGAVWVLFLDNNSNVKNRQEIGQNTGGFTGQLTASGMFGCSVTSLGDLNGDDISDIAVGACEDDDGGPDTGAVWILFMRKNGTVKSHAKISSLSGNFEGIINDRGNFGSSVSGIGDLDKDGIFDLGVGVDRDGESGGQSGALWILFLNSDGSVKSSQKINDIQGGFTASIGNGDRFGSSVDFISDLDADGVDELLVGAPGTDFMGENTGVVWILYMNTDGTVKSQIRIGGDSSDAFYQNIQDGDFLGHSIDVLGDWDGNGFEDIVVGASRTDGANLEDIGAVWVLYLEENGKILDFKKIFDSEEFGLVGDEEFGRAVTSIPDFADNRLSKLIVGTPQHKDTGGAVWELFVNESADLEKSQKISENAGSLTTLLDEFDLFGSSITSMGDLNGDGFTDLAVGAPEDLYGAVWVLFLGEDKKIKSRQKLSRSSGGETQDLNTSENIGVSILNIGDLDGDGLPELAVGAQSGEEQAEKLGELWVFFLANDGTVRKTQKIGQAEGGFMGELVAGDNFGSSLALLDDYDGDGIQEIAVGAPGPGLVADLSGSVWLLALDSDGKVKNQQQIGVERDLISELDPMDAFGGSLSSIVDLDGDGRRELVVGAPFDDDDGENSGAAWIVSLTENLQIKSFEKIGAESGNLDRDLAPGDLFGSSLFSYNTSSLDDRRILAVGSPGDDDGKIDSGSVWLLTLRENGEVAFYQKISLSEGGFSGALKENNRFGSSLSGFQIQEETRMLIGAPNDGDGGIQSGALWDLTLNLNNRTIPDISPYFQEETVFENTEVVIKSTITDIEGVKQATISFRRGGDSVRSFLSNSMERVGGQFEGVIPASLVTDRGIEFFITAEDSLGLLSRQPEVGFFEVIVSVDNKQSTNPLLNDEYQLFSIPLELDEKMPGIVLEDDLGIYDPTIWRFFEPTPNQNPSEFSEFPNTSPISPGKAYWLISEGPNQFISTGSGRTNSTITPFIVPLQPGWNYFGSPFTFSIPRENLKLLSGASLVLKSYSGTSWNDAPMIEPFKGYIVANNSTEVDSLVINAFHNEGNSTTLKDGTGDWSINVHVSSDGMDRQSVVALVRESAHSKWDSFDIPAAPTPMGDYLQAFFKVNQTDKPLEKLHLDARSQDSEEEIWELNLVSNSGRKADLVFDYIESVPLQYDVFVIDDAIDHRQNLRENNSYTLSIPSSGKPRTVRIVASKHSMDEFKSEELLPRENSISPSFPNPFHNVTTVSYSLAQESNVNLSVYSILGHRVATLTGNEIKQAGNYTAIWNGKDNADRDLASGIYFLKISSEFFSLHTKVILIR